MQKIILNQEEIVRMYCVEKKSTIQIAKELGIGWWTVARRLHEYSVKTKDHRHIDANKEWFEQKYLFDNLSQKQIAEILGCDRSAVRYWLKKYGIKTRDCGSAFRGKTFSEEHKLKISNALKGRLISLEQREKLSHYKGDLASGWKGGVRRTYNFQYKFWKEQVFKRDGYQCIKCGIKRTDRCERCGYQRIILNAHHIKPYVEFPELRFDVDNGQTLCHACHRLEHTHWPL